MTVGELKKKLEDYPDNREVLLIQNNGISYVDQISPGHASTFASKGKEPVVFIIPKTP